MEIYLSNANKNPYRGHLSQNRPLIDSETGNYIMENYNDWEEVTWAPTQRKTGRTEYCDKHPTECVCDNSPCREYSDNGYQFYIEYINEEVTP